MLNSKMSWLLILLIAFSAMAGGGEIDNLLERSAKKKEQIRKGGFFDQVQQMVSPAELTPPDELFQEKKKEEIAKDEIFEGGSSVVRRLTIPTPPSHSGRYVKIEKYYEDKYEMQKELMALSHKLDQVVKIAENLQSQSEGHDDRYGFVLKLMGSAGFTALLGLLGTIIAAKKISKKNGNGKT